MSGADIVLAAEAAIVATALAATACRRARRAKTPPKED